MTLKPPKQPCGTCPYRTDVPSGIWAREEYEKLQRYDGSILDQVQAGAFSVFMCHQRDGCLCGGWLATHGPENLLALRVPDEPVDPAVWDYTPGVEVFGSGAEAAAHGMAEIDSPSIEARAKIDGLLKARGLKATKKRLR